MMLHAIVRSQLRTFTHCQECISNSRFGAATILPTPNTVLFKLSAREFRRLCRNVDSKGHGRTIVVPVQYSHTAASKAQAATTSAFKPDETVKHHHQPLHPKRAALNRPKTRTKPAVTAIRPQPWTVDKLLPFKRSAAPRATITTATLSQFLPKPVKLLDTLDHTVLPSLYQSQDTTLSLYMGLSKFRLTTFVVLTAVAGYCMSTSAMLHPNLLLICVGTFLTSASANTFNQLKEVEYDGLMDRTKNRVLVKKLLTKEHALGFAISAGLCGVGSLYAVNELAAIIGLANLVLYAGVYTPMKRQHIANTWIGAVVGALPPLIGSAGACGSVTVNAALAMAGIMYCWQFPHFNALSWNLRNDYERAGYKMMCFVNPRLCRVTSLRYSVALSAICAASPALGVTDMVFFCDSAPFNAYLIYLSWKFYQNPDAKTSRNLFRYTLVHLPLLILLLIIGNKCVKEPKQKTVAQPA